ncbi:MAG: rod shape-determining protein [Blastocatellia bacterium]|nr:rod shape-determining protein [Blastocatellia bacterium]MCS7158384.1 rod shape-determining protein [Blastocatellia bacterium]MCX7752890.1 rod shape-determining protein [Blastocatellia bacterium]MDW8167946.1 rod shape-determining protein [Acidobacteriota bacterium]MDW8255971.1 rod shape-determining protein [Acidobacteriota bacterium]
MSRGLWRRMRHWFVHELAVDLGTANTLIYGRGRGLLVREPSVVAVNKYTGALVAAGRDALMMLGREPRDVVVQYPMRDGTVADDHLATLMLGAFLKRAGAQGFGQRIHVLVGVPSSATDVERMAVREIVHRAGADRIQLIEEGLAVALGIELPLWDGHAHMIVDIGGGTTGVSVVSAHGLIVARALRIAGNEMTEAILDYVQQERGLLIGRHVAEEAKLACASALPFVVGGRKRLLGKSVVTGELEEIEVTAEEIARAIERPIRMIVNAVRTVIEAVPPEVAADIQRFGIVLTGGGSLIRHLDDRLREELDLPISRAERPLEAVILGMAKLLERPELWEQFRVDSPSPAWEETILPEDARPSSLIPISTRTQERPRRRHALRG